MSPGESSVSGAHLVSMGTTSLEASHPLVQVASSSYSGERLAQVGLVLMAGLARYTVRALQYHQLVVQAVLFL